MKAYKIPPEKYWSTFRNSYHGPDKQASIIQKILSNLPQKEAIINIEGSPDLFNKLQAPWIPIICERYNIGGIKVLGDQFAPQPKKLSYFFSYLLNPSIQNDHFKYSCVLASGIKSGYLAIRERMGGKKKAIKNMHEFTKAINAQKIDIISSSDAEIQKNALFGEPEEIIDLVLGLKQLFNLVGINQDLLSDFPHHRSIIISEISKNIVEFSENNSHLNSFLTSLMLLNLGKLRWIESELFESPSIPTIN